MGVAGLVFTKKLLLVGIATVGWIYPIYVNMGLLYATVYLSVVRSSVDFKLLLFDFLVVRFDLLYAELNIPVGAQPVKNALVLKQPAFAFVEVVFKQFHKRCAGQQTIRARL